VAVCVATFGLILLKGRILMGHTSMQLVDWMFAHCSL